MAYANVRRRDVATRGWRRAGWLVFVLMLPRLSPRCRAVLARLVARKAAAPAAATCLRAEDAQMGAGDAHLRGGCVAWLWTCGGWTTVLSLVHRRLGSLLGIYTVCMYCTRAPFSYFSLCFITLHAYRRATHLSSRRDTTAFTCITCAFAVDPAPRRVAMLYARAPFAL